MACGFGTVFGSAIVYYFPFDFHRSTAAFAALYASLSFVVLAAVRSLRSIARDVFYAIDCSRIVARKDVSRILVYGAGLRYQAFRREFVRKTARNASVIVGLIDDDIFLRGQYVGDAKVHGPLAEASEIINRLNADTVVIACELPESRIKYVMDKLAPTGVRIRMFEFRERELN